MFETMNSRTHGSMHFVEIMKIGTNEWKYFHSMLKLQNSYLSLV